MVAYERVQRTGLRVLKTPQNTAPTTTPTYDDGRLRVANLCTGRTTTSPTQTGNVSLYIQVLSMEVSCVNSIFELSVGKHFGTV